MTRYLWILVGIVNGRARAVPDTARNDADFIRTNYESSQFCLYVQHSVLRNNQEIAISGVKCLFPHVLSSSIKQDSKTMFQCGVSRASHKMQTMDPVDCGIQVERIPSELVGDMVQLLSLGSHASVVGFSILGREVPMGSCWEDTIDPGLFVLVSRSCECSSRQLLGVEAIRSLLRRILSYWESTLNGFCSMRG